MFVNKPHSVGRDWGVAAWSRGRIVFCSGLHIIIMYIYYALINALSAHMIHINLNMILYTHVEHSPTKTICIKYYTGKTNTHTHYTLLGLCSLKFKMWLLDPPEI